MPNPLVLKLLGQSALVKWDVAVCQIPQYGKSLGSEIVWAVSAGQAGCRDSAPKRSYRLAG